MRRAVSRRPASVRRWPSGSAFANSAGQRLAGRGTIAIVDGIARTPTADGSAHGGSVRLADLDGAALGDRAARKARDASNPTDLDPGRYEVVLEPDCVGNILSFLLAFGFNGKAVDEGRSFAEVGTAQFDPAISLREDVTDPETVGIAFDVEGPRSGPSTSSATGSRSGCSTTAGRPRRWASRARVTPSRAVGRGARSGRTSAWPPARSPPRT